MKGDKRRSRRDFFKAGLAAGVGAALPASNTQAKGNGNSDSADDGLTFVNGRIHTIGCALSSIGIVCPSLVDISIVGGRVQEASASTVKPLSRSSANCSSEQRAGIPSACST